MSTTTLIEAAARPQWPFDDVWKTGSAALVPAGTGAPLSLPPSGRTLDGFALAAGAQPMNLPAFLRSTASDAFVVLKDGALVFQAYAQGLTPTSPHILMSASKAVTGIVAGLLQGAGRLNVEAQVSTYVPEVLGTAYEGASVRQLMDMRAAIRLEEAQLDAYERANDRSGGEGDADFGLHAFFETLDAPRLSHGTPFSYISANTDLVGWAIERAAGECFAELLASLLWEPMGAEADAWMTLDRQGAPQCARGVCATARDLARLGQLILQGGRREGAPVIPQGWVEDLFAGGDRKAWAEGEWGQSFIPITGPEVGYRAGWYSVGGPAPHLFAMGVHGQNLFIDRALGVVMVKLSSLQARIDPSALWLTHRAWDEVRRVLS
jgi:CubicO group peptidase (beta-lactamase class C family)